MNLLKIFILMNIFWRSKFSHCPLIWMCHNCTSNRKMNRCHERCPIIMKNTYLLKSSKKKMVLLSLFTTEIFNVLQLKCIKLIMGFPRFLSVIYLSRKIVILTICDRVLSFPDLFLKLILWKKKHILSRSKNMGRTFCYIQRIT